MAIVDDCSFHLKNTIVTQIPCNRFADKENFAYDLIATEVIRSWRRHIRNVKEFYFTTAQQPERYFFNS